MIGIEILKILEEINSNNINNDYTNKELQKLTANEIEKFQHLSESIVYFINQFAGEKAGADAILPELVEYIKKNLTYNEAKMFIKKLPIFADTCCRLSEQNRMQYEGNHQYAAVTLTGVIEFSKAEAPYELKFNEFIKNIEFSMDLLKIEVERLENKNNNNRREQNKKTAKDSLSFFEKLHSEADKVKQKAYSMQVIEEREKYFRDHYKVFNGKISHTLAYYTQETESGVLKTIFNKIAQKFNLGIQFLNKTQKQLKEINAQFEEEQHAQVSHKI